MTKIRNPNVPSSFFFLKKKKNFFGCAHLALGHNYPLVIIINIFVFFFFSSFWELGEMGPDKRKKKKIYLFIFSFFFSRFIIVIYLVCIATE